jgi:hypothetical protein
MTSPRQRKKRAAFLKKQEETVKKVNLEQHKPVVVQKQEAIQKSEPVKPVAEPVASVVASEASPKPKKTKTGLVELKSQDQIVEQVKEEVKLSTGE